MTYLLDPTFPTLTRWLSVRSASTGDITSNDGRAPPDTEIAVPIEHRGLDPVSLKAPNEPN